jgi:hypothetical protein
LIREAREPLRTHFGVQANLFDSGQRQEKAALASTKADLPSLPECKNLLLVAQKQLSELPLIHLLLLDILPIVLGFSRGQMFLANYFCSDRAV